MVLMWRVVRNTLNVSMVKSDLTSGGRSKIFIRPVSMPLCGCKSLLGYTGSFRFTVYIGWTACATSTRDSQLKSQACAERTAVTLADTAETWLSVDAVGPHIKTFRRKQKPAVGRQQWQDRFSAHFKKEPSTKVSSARSVAYIQLIHPYDGKEEQFSLSDGQKPQLAETE